MVAQNYIDRFENIFGLLGQNLSYIDSRVDGVYPFYTWPLRLDLTTWRFSERKGPT